MKSRPISITVIAWILMILAVVSFIVTTVNLNTPATLNNPALQTLLKQNPLPLSVQIMLLYFSMAVMLMSGIGFLRGMSSARYLYVIGTLIGLIIGVVTSPVKITLIPATLMFIVVAFFLFRPNANQYFASSVVKKAADHA